MLYSSISSVTVVFKQNSHVVTSGMYDAIYIDVLSVSAIKAHIASTYHVTVIAYYIGH